MRGPSLQRVTLVVDLGAGSVPAQDVVSEARPAGDPQPPADGGIVERFTLASGGIARADGR